MPVSLRAVTLVSTGEWCTHSLSNQPSPFVFIATDVAAS